MTKAKHEQKTKDRYKVQQSQFTTCRMFLMGPSISLNISLALDINVLPNVATALCS